MELEQGRCTDVPSTCMQIPTANSISEQDNQAFLEIS